jgi:hypothetical protein
MSLFVGVKEAYDKVFQVDSINIDTFVCKLHHRVTVTILATFSVLLSLQQVIYWCMSWKVHYLPICTL